MLLIMYILSSPIVMVLQSSDCFASNLHDLNTKFYFGMVVKDLRMMCCCSVLVGNDSTEYVVH